jgi:hypothetical protein
MSGADTATNIVRAYIRDISRGDRSGAAAYLATGTPNESFLDSTARITSVRTDNAGNGTYKSGAEVQTSTGNYYITFTIAPGPAGLQITDHFAIKTGP